MPSKFRKFHDKTTVGKYRNIFKILPTIVSYNVLIQGYRDPTDIVTQLFYNTALDENMTLVETTDETKLEEPTV